VVCTRSKPTAAFDHRGWSGHDGIGSSLLLRALQRNRDEGFEGRLLGLDINPQAGWLIPDNLLSGFELRVQHSVTALELLQEGEEPDLFIRDSDHRYMYEMAEYRVVLPHSHDRTVLLSDSDNPDSPLQLMAAETGSLVRLLERELGPPLLPRRRHWPSHTAAE
jgi:hypothetical protein